MRTYLLFLMSLFVLVGFIIDINMFSRYLMIINVQVSIIDEQIEETLFHMLDEETDPE